MKRVVLYADYKHGDEGECFTILLDDALNAENTTLYTIIL